MKSIHRIGLGAVFTVASAAVWLACGDDDTTPSNNSPMDAGVTPDVTTSNPDAGTETDAGTTTDSATTTSDAEATPDTGTEAGAAPSCTAYCSAVMSTCTGSFKQYLDTGECMTACALLPLGTAGDTSGNTVGCRTTHAGLAVTGGLNPHCWHAGPFGYGACGSECDSFCLLATSYCSADGGFDGGAPPYASLSACTTACAGFPKIDDADGGGVVGVDGGYTTGGATDASTGGPTIGNTLDCREWHLDNALDIPGSNAGQNLHCNHVGATSATCM